MRKGIILLLTLAMLIAALPVAARAEGTKLALGSGALVDGAPVWVWMVREKTGTVARDGRGQRRRQFQAAAVSAPAPNRR